ncbi:hypothetical protein ES319_A13G161000v1 [Gossypium barbadense]|uniref:Glycosyltransferase n=2 Tax=Gossypium TaxID=3633 RepID=A0A5J5T031_GOSBA|nr:hypothetical protein ES319_A13G161000v1 [Gossypium barbadense]TXG74934.1 hypothetical protein ES288_1Z041900v1 [Gossypium darwinii]
MATPTQEEQQLHFVVFPFMSQGHMAPMIDIARLLAQRGVIVTIITTPQNAARFKATLDRAMESGLFIRLLEVQFPCAEFGLPEGCESFDMLPSFSLAWNFYQATDALETPVKKLLPELTPSPNCILSDVLFAFTLDIANQFQIPRIVFHGVCCFRLVCLHNLRISNVLDHVSSETEYFVVPNMRHKVEFTKCQVTQVMAENLKQFSEERKKADLESYGVIINSFEEMEPEYVKEYKKTREDKVWCIGPVSLCNKDAMDKAQRGNKASVDEQEFLRWLDSQKPGTVIYACLGSISNLTPSQLIQLGLGLEASNRPFIWVIRASDASNDVDTWISEDGFEERTKGRGLVIRGWAPQVLILSHQAIGGFLTHCGWNSTIEGISAGVPLITWPLFADQFANEKLAVQIVEIGVRVGVEEPMRWGEEEKIGVLVKKEDVKEAIEKLMDEGEEGEERRKRAKRLGEMANKAVEIGGSSHLHISRLIQDIRQRANERKQLST